MKKFIFMMMFMASITLSSCCGNTAKNDAVEENLVEVENLVEQDSVQVDTTTLQE